MAYCTAADIEASEQDLIELTDDGGLGVIDQGVIDRAIATAGELIDGYLRGRYTLPLDPVPGLLIVLAADIVLYRLYGRRSRLAISESLTDKYKNALKVLENIQKGIVSLGAGLSGQPSQDLPSVSGTAQTISSERVFTRETLRDY